MMRNVLLAVIGWLCLLGCVSASSHYARGDAEYLRGNYEAALSSYRKAQRKDPELPDIDEKIRVTELRMFMDRGDTAVRRGDWDAARRAYEEVRYRDPENTELPGRLQAMEEARAESLYQQGERMLAEGDPFGAIGVFEEALAIDPAHSRAPAALEQARVQKRERERRAETAFQEARRARTQGRSEHALSLLEQAVELDPYHRDAQRVWAELRYELAESHVQRGDRAAEERAWTTALERYHKAAEYDPQYPGLGERMAQAEAEIRAGELVEEGDRAFELGDWGAAFACYQEAWALTTDRGPFQARFQTARQEFAEDLLSAAQSAELEGRVEDALVALDQLEQVDPTRADIDAARTRLGQRISSAKTSYAAGVRAQESFDLLRARDHFLACQQAITAYKDVDRRLDQVHHGIEQADQFYRRAQAAERQGDVTRARILYEECLAVCTPFRNALDRLQALAAGGQGQDGG